MEKNRRKGLLNALGSLMLAGIVIGAVYLAAILLEIPQSEKEGEWVVEEETDAVTPMRAADMEDPRALAQLFGAALPMLPGAAPAGEGRNAAYDGQTVRRVTLTYDGFVITAVRPAAAAPLLLREQLAVQPRSDVTVMNLPATLASRNNAYCAYFSDHTAAYSIYAPAANEESFLALLRQIQSVK